MSDATTQAPAPATTSAPTGQPSDPTADAAKTAMVARMEKIMAGTATEAAPDPVAERGQETAPDTLAETPTTETPKLTAKQREAGKQMGWTDGELDAASEAEIKAIERSARAHNKAMMEKGREKQAFEKKLADLEAKLSATASATTDDVSSASDVADLTDDDLYGLSDDGRKVFNNVVKTNAELQRRLAALENAGAQTDEAAQAVIEKRQEQAVDKFFADLTYAPGKLDAKTAMESLDEGSEAARVRQAVHERYVETYAKRDDLTEAEAMKRAFFDAAPDLYNERLQAEHEAAIARRNAKAQPDAGTHSGSTIAANYASEYDRGVAMVKTILAQAQRA